MREFIFQRACGCEERREIPEGTGPRAIAQLYDTLAESKCARCAAVVRRVYIVGSCGHVKVRAVPADPRAAVKFRFAAEATPCDACLRAAFLKRKRLDWRMA